MNRGSAATPDHVVIVGAGLAGLSAALHLAGAGVQVSVVEQAPWVGGRAPLTERTGRSGAYRLDTGPTVLTEIPLLAGCFAAVGERLEDWVELHRLDPAYQARFADGSALDLVTDRARMRSAVETFAGPAEAAGYDRFAGHVERLYEVVMPHFIDHNIDGLVSLLQPDLARVARLGGFGRLGPLVASFFQDERLRRAFSFQALYAGVSPARALGLFAVITAMDLGHGVSYPAGGMHAVPAAMTAAARAHGVSISLGERVERVAPRHGGGHRVHTDARALTADAVVLTAEPECSLALLGRTPRKRVVRSPSCVLLAAGVRGRVPGAAHHRIHFGHAWDEVFDDLADGRLMRDPSFLVSVPTRTDPSLAPAGCDVLYALFPAPSLDSGRSPVDWDRIRPLYRDQLLRHLATAGYGDLDIEVEELITPHDWKRRGLPAGTPFSAAHTFTQSGPFRQPSVVAPGVVLAGSGTTPGVGVPMVLISGRLAAERLVGASPS
ncbi:phytoene desaturase family protein [Leekyejoonella antrihumi]|uniref:Phytoene desaturase n=1 Tax=Leekyejoonella antrihumi TaxID=1660198 RepID=A0A563E349_9MICO|nr:phytoene desaturase family protein [Leekyejoonella antrihumi]TWP36960.1 phytoene desaturase [Leekyejoonella antrihumi]